MIRLFIRTIAAVTVFLMSLSIANATTIAIVQGGFYTSDLKNNLVAQGIAVSEIATYTAASLSAYDAVVHYGNSFTDTSALTNYVSGGGNLIFTPWAGVNFSVPSDLQIYGNGGSAQFSVSNPGINVLDATDPLLTGVSLPAGPGGFSIGRIAGIDFVAGVTEVLDWSDGVGMLGYKDFGLGTVFGLNMHVITSDTAYQVINQPWATQLIVNAANFGANNAVPEPTTIALIGLGLAGLGFSRRKQRA